MQSHSKGVVHYNLANTLVVVDHMHAVRYVCGSASKVFSCMFGLHSYGYIYALHTGSYYTNILCTYSIESIDPPLIITFTS